MKNKLYLEGLGLYAASADPGKESSIKDLIMSNVPLMKEKRALGFALADLRLAQAMFDTGSVRLGDLATALKLMKEGAYLLLFFTPRPYILANDLIANGGLLILHIPVFILFKLLILFIKRRVPRTKHERRLSGIKMTPWA